MSWHYSRVALVGFAVFVGCTAFARAAGKTSPQSLQGKPAPDIDVPAVECTGTQPQAASMKLSDFRDKKNVVLYFFPKALTGG
jgi:hypothetical protein